MGNRITGTKEWAEYSRNCVIGCSNDCHYCYAKAMAVLERAPPFCLTINNKYNIIFMSWGNPVNFGENSPALRRGRAICFNRSFF